MEEVMWKGLEILLGALGVLLGFLGTKLAQWVAAKVKNEYFRGVLSRLTDTIFAVVKEIEQTVAAELRLANADGKLDDEEKQRLKDTSLAKIKSYLGARGLGELAKVLGFDPQQIDAFLGTRVEAVVHDLKVAKASLLNSATSVASPDAPRKPLVPR